MKKKAGLLFLAVVMIIAIVGFSETITLTLWTAPNPNQNLFWKTLLPQWAKTHPNIKIKQSQIPAARSSEEAILTAIASNRQPDICTNIFSGFAAELVSAGQLVPLDSFSGFKALIKTRDMQDVIKSWKLKGHYYVMPIYDNPILVWWRKSMLEKAGFTKPPRTYSELYALSKKITIPHKRYAFKVFGGQSWWDRWWDFMTLYYAASEGKPYIDVKRNKAVFDNEYGKDVASFVYTMFKKHYTTVAFGQHPFFKGAVAGAIKGPWSIPSAKSQFPKVLKDVIIAPPLVPDNYPTDKPVYTFADAKGMIIFKSCKHKDAAWEFMKWVFSNPEHDLLWLKLTQEPPTREDLLTNPLFANYLKTHPLLAQYAKYVKYTVPPALSPKTIDIQQSLTNNFMEPLMYLTVTPQEAVKNAVKAIDSLLSQ